MTAPADTAWPPSPSVRTILAFLEYWAPRFHGTFRHGIHGAAGKTLPFPVIAHTTAELTTVCERYTLVGRAPRHAFKE